MSIRRIHKIRKIRILTWVVVGSLLAPGVAGAVQARQTDVQRRIVVSPDYLVSRDGDRPHVEIMAAANPRNARNLLAGAITFTRRDGGSATKAYVSRDGGIVWDDIIFPEQREMGGADPQVAFTAAGTALFLTLNTAPDETGRTRAFLHSYRSEDESVTWSDARSGTYGLGGGGARFVYNDALGTEGVLPPGGVSGAMLWRFRLAEPIRIPNLHVYVAGREVP